MLDRALEAEPSIFASVIFEQRARSFSALGKEHAAAESLLSSIERLRYSNDIRGQAPLLYALLVIKNQFSAHYRDALAIVEEFWEDDPLFPLIGFQQHAYRALLRERLGNPVGAQSDAQRALAFAARTRSSAQNHPALGLVADESAALIRRVRAIAGEAEPS